MRQSLRLAAVFVSSLTTAVIGLDAWQSGQGLALSAQIDRIFKAREFDPPRFGPARWLPDGTGYAIVERAAGAGEGAEIARYDATTGVRSVMVPASKLRTNDRGLDVDGYDWSADGKRLLIFTNTKKVWRQNTRGDYWVLDVASGSLKKIGGTSPGSSLMFAKFSPDGSRVAYVRANNIYVERLDNGKTTALTRDGSTTTINGTSDWVYEEELDLRDGFRWSPDGERIAYWQFDSTAVQVFSLIDDTTALYPTITKIPYPKVGTTNSAVRIGVVRADGGDTRWMKVPGDPRDNYLARLDWLDPGTVAIQQLNRLQNQNNFYLADARSGSVTRIFGDQSRAWVDLVEEVRWLQHGKAFLWLSERDGWRHVYRVPRSGGEGTLITRFDADVIDVVGTDEDEAWLYFLASPSNATERYLYRSKLDGSATPERVTPADQPGTHAYNMAPGGRMAFHTWSQFDRPPAVDVVALPAHRPLRALTDPRPLLAKLANIIKSPVEFLTVDLGGNPGPVPVPGAGTPAIVRIAGYDHGVLVAARTSSGRVRPCSCGRRSTTSSSRSSPVTASKSLRLRRPMSKP